jgi:hypothetical protein
MEVITTKLSKMTYAVNPTSKEEDGRCFDFGIRMSK